MLKKILLIGILIMNMSYAQNIYYGDEPKDVDNPAWNLVFIDTNGIYVTWQEKYGNEKTEDCIGLFENATEFRLTWKDSKFILIEKSNINSIKFGKKSK